MYKMKKVLGYLLSAASWLLAAIAIGGSGIYAISVVIWFHAPLLMVLAITLPIILILLGAAWVLNKAGVKLRRRKVMTYPTFTPISVRHQKFTQE